MRAHGVVAAGHQAAGAGVVARRSHRAEGVSVTTRHDPVSRKHSFRVIYKSIRGLRISAPKYLRLMSDVISCFK